MDIFEPRNLLPEFEATLPEGWTLDMNGNLHCVYYIGNVECIMWDFVNDLFFLWKYGNTLFKVSADYYVFDLDNNYIGIFHDLAFNGFIQN